MKPLILMYHRVAELRAAERYTVSPRQFARQMRYLCDRHYNIITISALMDWFAGRSSVPNQSVIITFDDGFLDTYEQTCPVLRDLGFHATFFIITGLIGKINTWMTSRGEPSAALMGWRELESLKQYGFEVGSHTVTHQDLSKINLDQARDEINGSKQALEGRLGEPVQFFSYPFGRYTTQIRELVREAGYQAACATATGFVDPTEDSYELRRIEVAGTDSMRTFADKLMFGTKRRGYTELTSYYLRRIVAKTFGE